MQLTSSGGGDLDEIFGLFDGRFVDFLRGFGPFGFLEVIEFDRLA